MNILLILRAGGKGYMFDLILVRDAIHSFVEQKHCDRATLVI